MALMNLGMGYDWQPQRNKSAVIRSEAEIQRANQSAMDQQKAALDAVMAQAPRSQADSLTALSNFGQQNYVANNPGATADGVAGWYGDAVQNGAASGTLGPVLGNFGSVDLGGAFNGYYAPGGAYDREMAAFQPQLDAARGAYDMASAAQKTATGNRANNLAVQQQAYAQQNGGGFSGGILNDSYSQPFANTITGAPSPQAGFGTGLMGGAGTSAAPSTGLTPFGAPGAAQGQQMTNTGGWGGPFSNKNPWSLG